MDQGGEENTHHSNKRKEEKKKGIPSAMSAETLLKTRKRGKKSGDSHKERRTKRSKKNIRRHRNSVGEEEGKRKRKGKEVSACSTHEQRGRDQKIHSMNCLTKEKNVYMWMGLPNKQVQGKGGGKWSGTIITLLVITTGGCEMHFLCGEIGKKKKGGRGCLVEKRD